MNEPSEGRHDEFFLLILVEREVMFLTIFNKLMRIQRYNNLLDS